MRHIAKALLRPRTRPLTRNICRMFCDEQKKPPIDKSTLGKIGDIAKKVWRTAFPNEGDDVKRKFEERKKKAMEKPKLTAEELEQIQLSIPEERRSALVQTKIVSKEEKKGIADKIIPETVKFKIRESTAYKRYESAHKQFSEFKEDLKEYIGSQDNVVFQAATVVYGKVSRGSEIARAIEYMRELDPEFEPENMQSEATCIFVQSYQHFLQCNITELDRICGEQAHDFFKSHINMYRTKKIKPKITTLWDHNPCQLLTAKLDDKSAPTFVFRIEVQQIYCFVDLNSKIVDGDDSRLNRCTFQFGMKATGKGMQQHGHNWQITEIRKIDQMKMLV